MVGFRRGRGFEVALLDTRGRQLRRFVGRDAAFFRDGRLLLHSQEQLWLVSGNRKRRLVGRPQLQQAAGFPISGIDLSGTDGYGRAGVVVSVWGQLRERLLLVRSDGRITPVTPTFKAERGETMPGPPAWSPDGRVLLIPWQHDHPTLRHSHEHCLARWTIRGGYRATVCRNPHFDRILWHPDGGTALLNNRLIVARDGTVRARLPSVGRAFGVRWKRPLLPRPR